MLAGRGEVTGAVRQAVPRRIASVSGEKRNGEWKKRVERAIGTSEWKKRMERAPFPLAVSIRPFHSPFPFAVSIRRSFAVFTYRANNRKYASIPSATPLAYR